MPNIVSLVALKSNEAAAIRALDASVELTEAGDWFQGEYAHSWPAATVARYVRGAGQGTAAQRDALLAGADIVLGGFPYPLDLRARAPRVQWVHQTPAGASNLRRGDLWGSPVAITTSRGLGETVAIAEYAIAGITHFAKGFDRAYADRERAAFDHTQYAVRSLERKTLCVIGAGGIGREIARLGKALGMQTVATRASPERGANDPVFDRLAAPTALHELLGESDYVAVSCQWTDATTNLLDDKAFAAMKEGAIVVNVARGEIIDETALLAALDAGHLRGAVLDVYVGEFESAPSPRLWNHPRLLITPHTSAMTDYSRRRSIELFCTNLRRFLDGDPLENQVDWSAGY
ncbi:MAG: glyoxylate/hydroxypyruvate reductase A [Gammaproteobacteria bacterium]|jgi:glyoxylate/hydroxypyruvate reductase A